MQASTDVAAAAAGLGIEHVVTVHTEDEATEALGSTGAQQNATLFLIPQSHDGLANTFSALYAVPESPTRVVYFLEPGGRALAHDAVTTRLVRVAQGLAAIGMALEGDAVVSEVHSWMNRCNASAHVDVLNANRNLLQALEPLVWKSHTTQLREADEATHRVALAATSLLSKVIATPRESIDLGPGEWGAFPPTGNDGLLHRIAVANCANQTADLDFIAGRTAANNVLRAVGETLLDNILLRNAVLSDQCSVTGGKDRRSRVYKHLGTQKKTILRILEDAGLDISHTDVKPVPMSPFRQDDYDRIKLLGAKNVVFNYTMDAKGPTPAGGRELSWQNWKLTTADVDPLAVLDLVASGRFANECFYLKDIDGTNDCKGVFVRRELFEYLRDCQEFHVRGQKFTRESADCTLLNNESDVGANCITWVTTIGGFVVRLKLYLKLVQELESAAVRDSQGQHIWDWNTCGDNKLAESIAATEETGMTRAEITVYFDRNPDGSSPPFDKAHLQLKGSQMGPLHWIRALTQEAVNIVPPKLVYYCPHRTTIANWVKNMHHSLVVYHTEYDVGLVVYGYNGLTKKLSCFPITQSFDLYSSYIMQLMTVADLPIDAIAVHGGRIDGVEHKRTSDRLGRQRTTMVFPRVLPQRMPEWVATKLGRKYEYDKDSPRQVPPRFPHWQDAEVDEPVVETDNVAAIYFSRLHRTSKSLLTEDDGDNAGPSEQNTHNDDMGDDETYIKGEARVGREVEYDDVRDADADETCDDTAAVHVELDPEGVTDQAVGDNEAMDGDDDRRSSITRIMQKRGVEDGHMVVETARFHRFAAASGKPLVTRFPPTTGISTTLCVNPVPKVPRLPREDATSAQQREREEAVARAEETIEANAAVATQRLLRSGFLAPPEVEGGQPSDVAGLYTEVPTMPFRAAGALHRYDLVQTKSWLTLQTQSIRPARTFTSYDAWPKRPRGRSNWIAYGKWFTDVMAVRTRKNSAERIDQLKKAAVERAGLGELHAHSLATREFAERISAMQTKSLACLEPGDHMLLAMLSNRQRPTSTTPPRHVLLVQHPVGVDGAFRRVTYASNGAIDIAMRQHRDALQHLASDYNGRTLVSRAGVRAGEPIGVLTRDPGGSGGKKRGRMQEGETSNDAPQHTRPVVEVGLKVDTVAVLDSKAHIAQATADALKAEHARQVSINTTERAPLAPLAPLPVKLNDVKKFNYHFPPASHKNGVTVHVQRFTRASYRGRKEAPIIEVAVVGQEPPKPVVIWAPQSVAKLFDEDGVKSGALLVVHEIHADGNVKFTLRYDVDDWVPPRRVEYEKLVPLHKGCHDQQGEPIGIITVDSVRTTENRNGGAGIVVRDADGKLWRFKRHDRATQLFTLEKGHRIDVAAWKPLDPVASSPIAPISTADASTSAAASTEANNAAIDTSTNTANDMSIDTANGTANGTNEHAAAPPPAAEASTSYMPSCSYDDCAPDSKRQRGHSTSSNASQEDVCDDEASDDDDSSYVSAVWTEDDEDSTFEMSDGEFERMYLTKEARAMSVDEQEQALAQWRARRLQSQQLIM